MPIYSDTPPTTNTLDPVQRKQLVKSAQKLGALLGTTPRVFEHGSALPPPLRTPATTAFRREGKLFNSSSASSSRSSLSSDGESFILLPTATDRLFGHGRNPPEPITVEFPHVKADKPVSGRSQHQRSRTTPQKLSQPLLYRLRSLPIPPPMSIPPPVVDHQPVPLSPASPITRVAPSKRRLLSESDRRRKMAKLKRTLGENIPPELVFGIPPRSSSLPKSSTAAASPVSTPLTKAPSRRNRSATNSTRPRIESTSRQNSSASDVPPSSSELKASDGASGGNQSTTSRQLPPQFPVVTVTTFSTETNAGAGKTTAKRRHRPRSLSIPISLLPTLVVERSPPHQVGRQPSRSLDEPDRRTAIRSKNASAEPTKNVEYGYRKEREWSGEWNLKDMQQVMGALRDLRL